MHQVTFGYETVSNKLYSKRNYTSPFLILTFGDYHYFWCGLVIVKNSHLKHFMGNTLYLPTTESLSPTKAHVHGLSLERENWATPHMEST